MVSRIKARGDLRSAVSAASGDRRTACTGGSQSACDGGELVHNKRATRSRERSILQLARAAERAVVAELADALDSKSSGD